MSITNGKVKIWMRKKEGEEWGVKRVERVEIV